MTTDALPEIAHAHEREASVEANFDTVRMHDPSQRVSPVLISIDDAREVRIAMLLRNGKEQYPSFVYNELYRLK